MVFLFLMNSHIMRFVSSLMVLFSVAYVASGRDSCHFRAMFNFGDSNSDTGTASLAFGLQRAPHGVTHFGSPSLRISDGRLMVDFMAKSLNFPYLNPFIDSMGYNFSHGANFACASATIMDKYKRSITPFTFVAQSQEFTQFVRKTKFLKKKDIYKGLLPKEKDISHVLFTIDIGHNDIPNSLLYYLSEDVRKANITEIVTQWRKAIETLYQHGARWFWIHNVGPLGCTPREVYEQQLNNLPADEFGCTIAHNEIVQQFNQKLKEVVVELRHNSSFSSAAFTYVDIYEAKYTLISQAKQNGFEEPFLTCCGRGGKFNYDPNIYCGTHVKEACEDPSVRISWDGIHYTEAANKWVFDRIIDGSYSDPPIPLKMACHRQGY